MLTPPLPEAPRFRRSRRPLEAYTAINVAVFQQRRFEGISLSTLKAVCRQLGIRRWPYTRQGYRPHEHAREVQQAAQLHQSVACQAKKEEDADEDDEEADDEEDDEADDEQEATDPQLVHSADQRRGHGDWLSEAWVAWYIRSRDEDEVIWRGSGGGRQLWQEDA
ncbi:hypothetical protein GUITHDRAFT_114287 [Guillardia theta CCMP2712]|uniref:RWP-RK domain-containing protein n=1 Tax=Guillardia theta (strain CCMP2712) TaxID=905079 RepID=L1IUI3_GUITC|nr:hypothetical protein GUITHDRAFT_114287 [Guillardia theta CCMP2712]EKX39559.1 hypothetical protein GUITHDRAFT_114287 [Guillardia theta CCMP2712]|eukprot:XP_005826539.1 hypothetical protein GUITHDRAFT_114287 [Guillardia theta CCMP2712]